MRDEAAHAILLAEQLRLEPQRMACEVRYVLALDRGRRAAYLDDGKLRPRAAGDALRAAVAERERKVAI